jgi:aminoglycoside phosphotransferase family enzyme
MITQLLEELNQLIANNTVLATLNFGAIGTVLLSVKSFLTKSKLTAETTTKAISESITTNIAAVEKKVAKDLVVTNKHIDVLKAQNDSLVTLLTIMVKHARWSGSAIEELSETLAQYKKITEKNVEAASETVANALNTLVGEVSNLAKEPKAETVTEKLEQTDSLVNKLFGEDA